MNIILWIQQVLLALHTITGAIWIFSNSEQTVDSLKAIPHAIWQSLSLIELLCSLGLIIPAVGRIGFPDPTNIGYRCPGNAVLLLGAAFFGS